MRRSSDSKRHAKLTGAAGRIGRSDWATVYVRATLPLTRTRGGTRIAVRWSSVPEEEYRCEGGRLVALAPLPRQPTEPRHDPC
jgi:hypothetical protein